MFMFNLIYILLDSSRFYFSLQQVLYIYLTVISYTIQNFIFSQVHKDDILPNKYFKFKKIYNLYKLKIN